MGKTARNTTNKRVKRTFLRYVVTYKDTKTSKIFHYKKDIAEELCISVRTLDRKIPFETDTYIVSLVDEVFS